MILGPIRFPTIAVLGYGDDEDWDYGAHAVIEGPERRQFVAKKGKPLTLSLKLHAEWMAPQDTIAVLKDLGDEHQVLPLQRLDGRLIGQFVITSVKARPIWTLPDGFLVLATVDVTLVDPGLEQQVQIPKPVAVVGTSSNTTTTPKAEDTTIDLDELTPQQIARR